jgi:S1-C subfamily serine protease
MDSPQTSLPPIDVSMVSAFRQGSEGREPAPPERRRLPMMLFLLLFLIGILTIPWLAEQIVFAVTRGQERAKAEIARKLLDDLPQPEQRVAWVAKAAGPSVVGIRTEDARGRGMGMGSGVIVDANGFVLTNYHVIADVRSISIQLSDGRTIDKAYLVGQDPTMDLALLKIDAPHLTPMPWGDSNAMEIGDAVVAIGNPFGLEHTVTSGIVSAKERYNPEPGDRVQVYLQTDAAINVGNSGGPLVNLRGELIGINTSIIGETFHGVGFAIPSILVRRVYDEIRKYGKVQHGWLGIAMRPPTAQQAASMGLETPSGVVVDGFPTPSPAQEAGMMIGDLIVGWNGEKVRDPLHLMHTIILSKPNIKAKVEVIRDGKKIELDVVLGTRPVMLQR